MGRRRKGRAVHGMLILDKPSGITSNHALQRVKKLFDAAKAGHTGILDPLATGVLPLCFGEATKFAQFGLDSDKGYRSTFKLGVSTSTADSEGEVIEHRDASGVTLGQVEQALNAFRGDILQVPPMVSALKHQGQPLYKLARQGKVVDRPARDVTVYSLDVLDFRAGEIAEVDVKVLCSKGTYIRSIASDLGEALGCGGHVAGLRRFQAGSFGEEQSISLERLEELAGQGYQTLDALLDPVDTAIAFLPKLELDHDCAHYFSQGQAIFEPQVYQLGDQGDKVRVARQDGVFLGVARITDEGSIAPHRLVVLD